MLTISHLIFVLTFLFLFCTCQLADVATNLGGLNLICSLTTYTKKSIQNAHVHMVHKLLKFSHVPFLRSNITPFDSCCTNHQIQNPWHFRRLRTLHYIICALWFRTTQAHTTSWSCTSSALCLQHKILLVQGLKELALFLFQTVSNLIPYVLIFEKHQIYLYIYIQHLIYADRFPLSTSDCTVYPKSQKPIGILSKIQKQMRH